MSREPSPIERRIRRMRSAILLAVLLTAVSAAGSEAREPLWQFDSKG